MVSTSAVWDRTTEFLGDNLGPVAAIAGIGLFLPNAVEGVLQPLGAGAGTGLRLSLSLLSLAFAIVMVWTQLALTVLALEPATGSGGAWRRATGRLLPMIGVSLILLAVVMVLLIPVFGLLIAGGVDPSGFGSSQTPSLPPGTAGLIALYLLVALPVMLWAGARLMPLAAVVAAERRGAGAIGRAFALTRGLALRLVGVVLLYLIVAGVAGLAAKTVVGSIARLALGDHGPIDAASIVTAIVGALVSAILTTVAVAFAAKLYQACVADPARGA